MTTLDELAKDIGNKTMKAIIVLSDFGYTTRDYREVMVRWGVVGYELNGHWVRVMDGDVLKTFAGERIEVTNGR